MHVANCDACIYRSEYQASPTCHLPTCVILIVAALIASRQVSTLAFYSSFVSEGCLGPGFAESIPPQEELSQYSATVLKPGDRAIYTALSFRCNGTLVSLTIPSQVRGSDYSRVDDYLEPRPSIWRFNGGYKFISENEQRQMVPGATNPRNLNDGEVISFNFTVMLQMDIQAGDVLGFRLLELGRNDRIEHLPLLYKPGPTPGSFTPIVIANFTATSDYPPTKPGPSDGEFEAFPEFESVAK